MNEHERDETPEDEPITPPPLRPGAWKTPSFALPLPPALPLPLPRSSAPRALPPAQLPSSEEVRPEEEPPFCAPEVDIPSPEIDFDDELDSLCADLLGPDESPKVPPEAPPAPFFAAPSKGAQGSERLWSAFSEKGPTAPLPESSEKLEPRLRLVVAAPPRAGKTDLVTFRLTVVNTGTGSASEVVLCARCEGSANPASVSHSFSLMKSGQSETVVITATGPEADQLLFSAEAHSAEGCSATVSVPVALTAPKLGVRWRGPDRVAPGQPLGHRLEIENAGTGDASGVVVECEIPAGLDFVSASEGVIHDPRQRKIHWQVERLATQETRNLDLCLALAENGEANELTLTAQAHCAQGLPTRAEVLLRPEVARLAIALTGPERIFTGQDLEYRLSVANRGTANSFPTQATCLLPTELCFRSASEGGRFDSAASRVEWEMTALSPGDSRTLTMRLTAALPATVQIQARCGNATVEKELTMTIDETTSTGLLQRLLAEVDREMGEQVAPKPVETSTPLALAEEGQRFLLFTLAGIHYAIPADRVLEVGRPPRVTAVPNVPDWVLGLTNVRGDITSVVDLRNFLGLETASDSPQNRILIVQSLNKELTTALLVDSVLGIRRIPPDTFQAPEAVADDRIGPLVRGVGEYSGGLLVALDLDHLLQGEEMRQFEFA